MATGDPEEVNYRFRMDREVWTRWKETVPRTTALHDRIATLISQDLAAARRGGFDDMDERTARLLASRIQHRGQTALQALDRGDHEKVADELTEMIQVAKAFED